MDSIWLLRLFTNVAKLELPYWNFRNVTVSRLAQLLGHFGSTVRGLKLAGIRLGQATLMHLVWLLPLVDGITIRALYLAFDGSGPPPIEDRPPEARRVEGKLVIQEFEEQHMDFLDFISDGSPSFHAITIVRCAPCEQSLRLINACGSTLMEFQYSTNALSGISGNSSLDLCDVYATPLTEYQAKLPDNVQSRGIPLYPRARNSGSFRSTYFPHFCDMHRLGTYYQPFAHNVLPKSRCLRIHGMWTPRQNSTGAVSMKSYADSAIRVSKLCTRCMSGCL
jgi:hypothetical protein